MSWPDRGVKICACYFCICGLVLFALDMLAARRAGPFSVVTAYSLPVARLMMPLGFLASLAILIGRPSRLILFVGALLLAVAFAAGTGVAVYLMSA